MEDNTTPNNNHPFTPFPFTAREGGILTKQADNTSQDTEGETEPDDIAIGDNHDITPDEGEGDILEDINKSEVGAEDEDEDTDEWEDALDEEDEEDTEESNEGEENTEVDAESDQEVWDDMDDDAYSAYDEDEPRTATENKLHIVLKALRGIHEQVTNAISLLETGDVDAAASALSLRSLAEDGDDNDDDEIEADAYGRIIEGVFDGQHMIGSDGKNYTVPPNYASKSKLVEGDMLKLTISPRGGFIYKQIGPIDRTRVISTLGFDKTIGQYYAATEDKRWNILRASVTYFKGDAGDEVVVLIPRNTPSKWAAVETIIRSTMDLE